MPAAPATYRFSSFVYEALYEIEAGAQEHILLELPWADEAFVGGLKRFSRTSLIREIAYSYFYTYWLHEFRDNPEQWIDPDDKLNGLFADFAFYRIEVQRFKAYCRKNRVRFDEDLDALQPWSEANIESFEKLFVCYSREIEHVLFANRHFLFRIHTALAALRTQDNEAKAALPGRIKRVAIPKWAKDAAYFRDHGRCVFCNVDLSGLVDLKSEHFDHMVSLADGGVNDVSNLQLTCAKCNLKKNRKSHTAYRYAEWWPDE